MANENETVELVCERYQSVMPIPTDEIIAAHKRELTAKDAEIEKLKMIIRNFAQHALLNLPRGCCMDCDECKQQGRCFPNDQTMVGLVEEAMEVIGENRAMDGAARYGEGK